MPTITQISGALTFGGFLACLYLLHWQIRIHPGDRQQWAATAFFLSFAFILGQLAITYMGGPPLGASYRGILSFAAVMLSLVWLAWETRVINLQIIEDNAQDGANEHGTTTRAHE